MLDWRRSMRFAWEVGSSFGPYSVSIVPDEKDKHVQPSTVDNGVSVIGGHGGLGEKTSHEESNHTGQGVDGEDIHWVIDSHGRLESGTQVRNDRRDDTDQGTSGCATESSSRSYRNLLISQILNGDRRGDLQDRQ